MTGRSPTIAGWISASIDPAAATKALLDLLSDLDPVDPAWISIASREQILSALSDAFQRKHAGDQLPLLGVPYAVKDNIDVVGFATTAGCPDFAYHPQRNATVVEKLSKAGAICVGKTNLDQFATGLVGTRTPYGAVPNSINPLYVAGGSSAGSASVVARGLVPFALGTDTAGSGRIPAGANNIFGLKPTRGAWSTAGLVPACRTLDCITVFASKLEDLISVDDVTRGCDLEDVYSRPALPVPVRGSPVRIGVPQEPILFDDEARSAWQMMRDTVPLDLVPLDFTPLMEVASLLYDGPWVAERLAAIESFFLANRQRMDPVVAGILASAERLTAVDTFRGMYRLAELKPAADALMAGVDALIVPTMPFHPTISEVRAEPIMLNSRLGTYTNFVNLLDWSALAVPFSFRTDGLPFGITLIGPAWSEASLIAIANELGCCGPAAI